MATINRPRRFYLHKRIEARQFCNDTEHVWRAKQEAQPGILLPSDFPNRTRLAELGYTTYEDLHGADAAELARAGLTRREATQVLAAL